MSEYGSSCNSLLFGPILSLFIALTVFCHFILPCMGMLINSKKKAKERAWGRIRENYLNCWQLYTEMAKSSKSGTIRFVWFWNKENVIILYSICTVIASRIEIFFYFFMDGFVFKIYIIFCPFFHTRISVSSPNVFTNAALNVLPSNNVNLPHLYAERKHFYWWTNR